ncbi:LysM-like peptidoglycan-binding domain-containing protein [Rouxiella sp. T17]|uniref:OapA family protein n=1 Tax=Rouxiella sp. T17 TaxID=3085684 RepID=UPI002FC5930C
MGQYTPRRRKATRIYQPMLKSWISIIQRPLQKRRSRNDIAEDELADTELNFSQEREVSQEREASQEIYSDEAYSGKTKVEAHGIDEPVTESRSRKTRAPSSPMKLKLEKIWHLSDNFHWMAPLPYFHRRWIIVSVIVVLLALLWPYSPENNYAPSEQPTSIPMQADLRNEQGRTTEREPQNTQSVAQNQGNWQSYQIQPGQTLAQLFRDNNLMVNDVFAMAQVEGDDKPLSNLHAGQQVRIQLNSQGVVSSLQVMTDQNGTITFTRQSDGSYQRLR